MAAAKKPPAGEMPPLEWVAGLIGLALILLTVFVIGREALFGDRSPPAVAVRALDAAAVPGGWRLRIEVENTGGEPAAQVLVEGEAGEDTAETTFDYVPAHSKREGGLFFETDPRAGPLKLRAKGYVEP